jgi:hypothetical protein
LSDASLLVTIALSMWVQSPSELRPSMHSQ